MDAYSNYNDELYRQDYDHFYNDEGSDSLFFRWLAGEEKKKEEEPLDYSVLSVGVMTLGLILCVEVLRHRLDHIAEYKPFFKCVLEATYSECKSSQANGETGLSSCT